MTQDDKIKTAEQLLNESGNEKERKLIEIQEALKEDKRVLRLQAKIKSTAVGSIANMEAQFKLNRIYLENMTDDERYGTEEGQQLEGDTGELYRTIRDTRKALTIAERPPEPTEIKNKNGIPLGPDGEPLDPWILTPKRLAEALGTAVATAGIIWAIFG
mgnify:FL=1